MLHALTKPAAGFLAGALAVLIFHQGMVLVLQKLGLPLRGPPWNMAGNPSAFGMPVLLNQMFWGGLWGILFAYLHQALPGNMGWLKGIVFGMIFPMLFGSWLVVAAIKGQPLFSGAFVRGFDVLALRNGFLLNGIAFGIGLGILYPLLARAMPGSGSARSSE
jgi:hypothetical protein